MSKRKKQIIIGFFILLAALIAVGGYAIYQNYFQPKPVVSDGVTGKISPDWDPGETTPENTQNSGTQIPGYTTAEMRAGDTSLHLNIGNPKSNECGFFATLKLEDGTVLYTSDLLEPGFGLTDIPLSQTLEKGEYTALVCYECVTLDSAHKPLNSAESEFTLVVK